MKHFPLSNKLRAIWLAIRLWTPLKSVWYRLGGLDYEPGEVVRWTLALEIGKIVHQPWRSE